MIMMLKRPAVADCVTFGTSKTEAASATQDWKFVAFYLITPQRIIKLIILGVPTSNHITNMVVFAKKEEDFISFQQAGRIIGSTASATIFQPCHHTHPHRVPLP